MEKLKIKINFAYLTIDEELLKKIYKTSAQILEIENAGGGVIELDLKKFRNWYEDNAIELETKYGSLITDNKQARHVIILPIKNLPQKCIKHQQGTFQHY